MQFWCGTAFMDTAAMPPLARILDHAGYHGVLVSDHMTYPRELSSPYMSATGEPFWPPDTAWPDSWVMVGAMAAVTERLRFSNAVYVPGARPIIEVAKLVATASVVSGGRVALGVGAGWMREEFELMGQDFDNRGARLDEMIQALRELWKGGWVSWDGPHYRIPELMLEPHPAAPVPIFCGGETKAALRRAARYCDGWIGTMYTLDEATRYVERLHELRRTFGREHEPFEVIVALVDDPSVDLYRRAEDAGITGVMCMPWASGEDLQAGEHGDLKHEAEHYRGAIERFAEDIVAKCR